MGETILFLILLSPLISAQVDCSYTTCDNVECDCRNNVVPGCYIKTSGSYNIDFSDMNYSGTAFVGICSDNLTISNSVFKGLKNREETLINVPWSGKLTIKNSVFDAFSVNNANHTSQLTIVNSTFYRNCAKSLFLGGSLEGAGPSVIKNNVFINNEPISRATGRLCQSSAGTVNIGIYKVAPYPQLVFTNNIFLNTTQDNNYNRHSIILYPISDYPDGVLISNNRGLCYIGTLSYPGLSSYKIQILNNVFHDPAFPTVCGSLMLGTLEQPLKIVKSQIRGNRTADGTVGGFFSIEGGENLITSNKFASGPSVLIGSTASRFYLNDINRLNVSGRTANYFDDGVKNGNHWYNYDEPSENCIDADGNGRCDTPYTVYNDPLTKDNFPLVKGRVDLAPSQTILSSVGIEPIQILTGMPLVKNKATMVRSFVDLLDENNKRLLNLNLLNKAIRVEATLDNQFDSEEVFLYNWKDYRLQNPSDQNTITYALPTRKTQIVKDFNAFVQNNDLEGVRKLVHTEAIDAVNLFEEVNLGNITGDETNLSILIDSRNEVVESTESNNSPISSFQTVEKNPEIRLEMLYIDSTKFPYGRSVADLQREIARQRRFIVANYPFPTNEQVIINRIQEPCGIKYGLYAELVKCLLKLEAENKIRNAHRIYFWPSSVNFKNAFGFAVNRSYNTTAFVNEYSPYTTSAHELGHQFGLGEQYTSNHPDHEEYAWRQVKNIFPHGFMSCDTIPNGCYGWDVVGLFAYENSGSGIIGPFAPKISVKPFDRGRDYEGSMRTSPNYYSFMGTTTLIGESLPENYFARWLDHISGSVLWQNITNPSGTGSLATELQRVATVSGRIFDSNNSVEFEPFFVSQSIPSMEFDGTAENLFLIEVLDANNTLLKAHRFIPSFVEDSGQTYFTFSVAVTFPQGSKKILLKRNGLLLGEKTVSNNSPVIVVSNVIPQGQDSYQVEWSAADQDNDQLFYTVEYSHNGVDFKPVALSEPYVGQAFDFNAQKNFPGSSLGFLRFIVTDGINTSFTDSPVFAVSNKPPLGAIILPRPKSSSLDQNILLEGSGYDEEDGALPDNAFNWASSLDGFLGNGQKLTVGKLAVGKHHITLLITDSQKLETTDTIELNVCKALGNGRKICAAEPLNN